jgi:hypothetical protein
MFLTIIISRKQKLSKKNWTEMKTIAANTLLVVAAAAALSSK